jgi:hypothetical protein
VLSCGRSYRSSRSQVKSHPGGFQIPRYIVERTLPEGLRIPVTADGAELCRTVTQRNAGEYGTWVHSYVSDDKRRTFCVHDARGPEAIRKAERNKLPVENIGLQVLDPYFYM